MILYGDVQNMLKLIASESVQTVVTSPPYWGLRDYGVDGQLGLEETPEEFVSKMIDVFRGVRRVLKNDGTLWMNMGDSYASSGKKRTLAQANAKSGLTGGLRTQEQSLHQQSKIVGGLKPKDLAGIPWTLALALRADGWYLRQDIIWAKPNPMPESVTDRCTKSHEYIFLMSKSDNYYFSTDAIKEPAIWKDTKKIPAGWAVGDEPRTAIEKNTVKHRASKPKGSFNGKHGDAAFRAVGEFRNKRSVWTIPTYPFPEAHYATFPPALVEPCILAGSRPGDTVLDPFLGSGTTGMVAAQLGRRWIGIELNSASVDIAKRRIANARK